MIAFTLIFNNFSIKAQDHLDENFKKNANKYYNIEYQIPTDYYGIVVEHCPLYFSDNSVQSWLHHSIKNDKLNFEVAFSLIIAKPLETPRSKRAREILGDPGRINIEAITNESDTILSKVEYLNTLQLKKVNADRGVIYNLKVDYKYRGVYVKCKKIALYKDNMGRVEILFFYMENQEKIVNEEIEKTWGMLKFKYDFLDFRLIVND